MDSHEERDALLAETDDSAAFDDDDDGQIRAMQEMMGFSSFGGVPKPKRQARGPQEGVGFGFASGANSQPVQPRNTSISTIASTSFSTNSHPFVPASLPPRPRPRARSSISTAAKIDDRAIQQTPAKVKNHITPQTPAKTEDYTAQPNPSAAIETTSTLNADSPPFVPQQASDSLAGGSNWNRTTGSDADLDTVGYTNPTTGYQLTVRELQAYERGVVEQIKNQDGSVSEVKVYFKPNFIMDNPWKDFEIDAGL